MAQLAIKNACDAYKRDKTICPVFDLACSPFLGPVIKQITDAVVQ